MSDQGAFLFLLADVHQRYAGAVDLKGVLGKERTDFAELPQYVGLAVGVGPNVDHDGVAAVHLRYETCNGGPQNALDGPDTEQRPHVHRTRVARAAKNVHRLVL